MGEKKEIFIGAKPLSEAQVKITVPTYDYIFTQIEEIRENALKNNKNISKEYNNTLGLFGERGTGKTSAIKTIIQQLKKDNNEDIILPIIEPDNFGENTKILGAILNGFKKEVENIIREIKNSNSSREEFQGFFENCIFKEKNSLSIAYDKVIEFYCYKEDEYRKLLTKDYTDMSTYKKKVEYILNPDMEFKNKFRDFIDIFIKVKRDVIKVKKDVNLKKEPLIFLFIDDVDLKTQKCKELIESVMQYTCHPNLVCFLSGDYEILKEAITIGLLEGEKIINSNILDCEKFNDIFSKEDNSKNLFNRKKYLANEYLKKVLPPAFRHNVVKWDGKSIPNFTVIDQEDNKEHLYEKLIQLFGENNIFTYNILDNKGKRTKLNIESSYKIFDKTPRGLVNVYYYLSKLNKEKFEKNNEYRFIYVKSLIDTIVNSSSVLINYQKELFDEYLKWGSNEDLTVINFNFNENIEEMYADIYEDIYYERIYYYYFLLLDCVRNLLPNAIYDKEKYIKAKKVYSFKNENESIVNNIINSYNTRLGAMKDIVCHAETNFTIAFLQVIYNYKIDVTNINKDAEKLIFNAIHDLLIDDIENKNKNIRALNTFKSWYNLKYSDNHDKMRNILQFLDINCRIPKNYEVTEKTFKNVICFDDKENFKTNFSKLEFVKKNRELFQKPELNVFQKDIEIKEYIYSLIINTLNKTYDNKNDYELKNFEKEEKKLFNVLRNINNGLKETETGNSKHLKENVVRYIEKSTKKLVANILNEILYEREVIFNINLFDKASKIYKFICNSKDCNYNTIYRKTGTILKKIIYINNIDLFDLDDFDFDNRDYDFIDFIDFIDFDFDLKLGLDEYILIIMKLEYLAYKTDAWYGVMEARELLEEIKNNIEISENIISYNISCILSEYRKYKEMNDDNIKTNIKTNNINNMKRILIKELLNKAFDEVRNDVKNDISNFGLELEDVESDVENLLE